MKLTFEGKTMRDVLDQMEDALAIADFLKDKKLSVNVSENAKSSGVPSFSAKGPGPQPLPEPFAGVDNPVDNPVDKPVDKMAKVRAAKAKKAQAAPAPKPADPEFEEDGVSVQVNMDPVEIVKIRQKTIEDLQSAYANGHQKEVFELLSRFGNGAKSFRELPPEAFVPIRDAIDNGALT